MIHLFTSKSVKRVSVCNQMFFHFFSLWSVWHFLFSLSTSFVFVLHTCPKVTADERPLLSESAPGLCLLGVFPGQCCHSAALGGSVGFLMVLLIDSRGFLLFVFCDFTHRAETFVVKLAQSFAYNSLVVPVMSSHWAGAVPPTGSTPSDSQTSLAKPLLLRLRIKTLMPLFISCLETFITSCTRRKKEMKWTPLFIEEGSKVMAVVTYDGAEQPQAGGVALARVPRTLPPRRRQRDPQPNGPVELAPTGLHRHHRAEICLVTQQLGDQLVGHRLSLRSERSTGWRAAHDKRPQSDRWRVWAARRETNRGGGEMGVVQGSLNKGRSNRKQRWMEEEKAKRTEDVGEEKEVNWLLWTIKRMVSDLITCQNFYCRIETWVNRLLYNHRSIEISVVVHKAVDNI